MRPTLDSVLVCLAVPLGMSTLTRPAPLEAQPRASERSQVTQRLNGTTIIVDYSRPVARGREHLFGGVLHWGEFWTPGANWATTLEVDKPVELSGHAVQPGKYSVWMNLVEAGPWTLVLNSESRLYHDSPVPEDKHVLEIPVTPEEGPHMEALAWYFPVIGPLEATLRMHWGSTFVPLTVTTKPFRWTHPPAEVRARYAGTYAMDGKDPTTGGPLVFPFTIVDEDGELQGRWGRAPVAMVPVSDNEFRVGFMRNGELFDVGDEMTIRVIADGDGPATAVELRWEGTQVAARGERVGG